MEEIAIKLTLFTGGIILYVENPQGPTEKLLELINELSKVVGHKVNIQ